MNVGDTSATQKSKETKSKWVSAAHRASGKNPVKASILGIGVKTAGLTM